MSTCGFTGYRYEKLPFPPEDMQSADALRDRIYAQCLRAYREGCTHFISGFARGCDLFFAEAVLALKKTCPDVTLEAALPFPGSLRPRGAADRAHLQALFAGCEKAFIARMRYTRESYFLRNDYIVSHSDRMIAVYDGKSGGTAYTLRRAKSAGVPVEIIRP